MNDLDELRGALHAAAATVAAPADPAELAVRRGRAAARRRRTSVVAGAAVLAVVAVSLATVSRREPVPNATGKQVWASWPERGKYARTEFSRRALRSSTEDPDARVLWSGDTPVGMTALVVTTTNGRPELQSYHEDDDGGAGGQRSGLALAASQYDPEQPPVLATQLRPDAGDPVYAFLLPPGATSAQVSFETRYDWSTGRLDRPWQAVDLEDGLALTRYGSGAATPTFAGIEIEVVAGGRVVYSGPVERARDLVLELTLPAEAELGPDEPARPVLATTVADRTLLLAAVRSWLPRELRDTNVAVRALWSPAPFYRQDRPRVLLAHLSLAGDSEGVLALYVEGGRSTVARTRRDRVVDLPVAAATDGTSGFVVVPPGSVVEHSGDGVTFTPMATEGGAAWFPVDGDPSDDAVRVKDAQRRTTYTGPFQVLPQ